MRITDGVPQSLHKHSPRLQGSRTDAIQSVKSYLNTRVSSDGVFESKLASDTSVGLVFLAFGSRTDHSKRCSGHFWFFLQACGPSLETLPYSPDNNTLFLGTYLHDLGFAFSVSQLCCILDFFWHWSIHLHSFYCWGYLRKERLFHVTFYIQSSKGPGISLIPLKAYQPHASVLLHLWMQSPSLCVPHQVFSVLGQILAFRPRRKRNETHPVSPGHGSVSSIWDKEVKC